MNSIAAIQLLLDLLHKLIMEDKHETIILFEKVKSLGLIGLHKHTEILHVISIAKR